MVTLQHDERIEDGSVEDHLVGLTKPTIDRILRMEHPGDCLALYAFYCYTRKWQRNNAVYATSEYAMTALGWGRDRFAHAKAQLKAADFIYDIQRKDAEGKVSGWYVGVRFSQSIPQEQWRLEAQENHPTDFPQGGLNHRVDKATVWENTIQIPYNNNKIPYTNKDKSGRAQKTKTASKPDDVSEQVWNDFLSLRKAKKAPVTAMVIDRIAKEATRASYSLEEALSECIFRGWQGFNADWVNKQQFNNQNAPRRAC